MKRSDVNARIRRALEICGRFGFSLPAWATWPPDRWATVGEEAEEIRRCGLGWDVTDFGSGDYERVGLLAFTLRNGSPGASDAAAGQTAGGKTYCEKMLLIGEGQVTPTHFHWSKTEDIINRAGGKLVLEVWNARGDEEIDTDSDVTVSVDGFRRTVPAGGQVVLTPGESITLPAWLYHRFYAQPGGGVVLGGEVSKVNDDANDNRFQPPLPRFSAIEEDQPPAFLLCNEYPHGGEG